MRVAVLDELDRVALRRRAASRMARLLPRFSSPSPHVIVTGIGCDHSRVRRTPPTKRAIRSKRGKFRS